MSFGEAAFSFWIFGGTVSHPWRLGDGVCSVAVATIGVALSVVVVVLVAFSAVAFFVIVIFRTFLTGAAVGAIMQGVECWLVRSCWCIWVIRALSRLICWLSWLVVFWKLAVTDVLTYTIILV